VKISAPKGLSPVKLLLVMIVILSLRASGSLPQADSPKRRSKPILIAHRGASAYAPEHTQAAYELAIKQGTDYVEQDLQMTKDGVLICSHDAELSRTTNVEEVFPDRAVVRNADAKGPKKGWYAVDFTLAEVKRLDAGSWFNQANPFAARKEYAGVAVPTLEEAIRIIGTRARPYIEMKYVPFYESMGKDMVGALAAVLRSHHLEPAALATNSADPLPPVFIQSFSKASLLKLKELAPAYPRIQLLPMEDPGREKQSAKVTEELAREVAAYAQGAGPAKEMLVTADDVSTFHRAGLKIHPFTFRGSATASARRPLTEIEKNGKRLRDNLLDEMRRYQQMGIDGGFTDYPDLWKEAVGR
jgi:glycerophosphoryl diester phosphodiesterase